MSDFGAGLLGGKKGAGDDGQEMEGDDGDGEEKEFSSAFDDFWDAVKSDDKEAAKTAMQLAIESC